jgi:predicted HD phosphohydrolase
MNINSSIDKILSLYTKWGSSDYIGESVTQIEHALQCAEIATKDPRIRDYDDFIWKCVVVAALLHDVGHVIGMEHNDMEMRGGADNASLGIVGHEGVGGAFLKEIGMPSLVCNLVNGHVMAKRYLCTVREGYYEKLSDASKETMKLQGGLMTNDEIKEFEERYLPELCIYIREYDDEGKKKELNLSSKIGLDSYRGIMESVLLCGRLFV